MITIKQISNVIEDLYNNITKTNTDVSISINTELKKFYGYKNPDNSTVKLPGNVTANMREISCTPIGVDGVISFASVYNIEMLVPENYVEANKHVWKSLQMEYQGKLVDLSNYIGLGSYDLKLSFEDTIEAAFTTRSNGNCKVVSIIVHAFVDQNIVNGSAHTFALVVNEGEDDEAEYNVPFTRFEFGEVKNLRAGNFGENGRIGSIVQSQNFSCTLYCVLPKDNFWKNVILPILFSFSGYEATLKIGIDGSTYVIGETDDRASIPVIVNILNYAGTPTDGIICAINCVYRG